MNGTGDAVVQARNGRAPIRWGGPAPEQADPTGGRHAFDSEAALTPIFTTLRRSGWCAQPDPAPRPARPLWPVPDQVERFHDDPWTAEIPVVPPLHVVPDPVVPPPSHLETTMMWHAVDGPMVPQPAAQRFDGYAPDHGPAAYEPEVQAPAGYDRYAYDSARYEPAGYDPAVYDLAPYEPYQHVPQGRRPYEVGGYDAGGYDSGAYDHGAYDHGGYDHGAYDARGYDRGGYGSGGYDRGGYEPAGYDPVKDTGRHHVRLAPAGW